jgi:hypothetical protein
MELLRVEGSFTRADGKSYRQYTFLVPEGVEALRFTFAYDRGGDLPHSLVTLQVFDPHSCRGAAHRFAPRQEISIGRAHATPGFMAGLIPPGEWMVEADVHCVIPRADGRANSYCLNVEGSETEASRVQVPDARSVTPGTAAPGSRVRGWCRGELHIHSEHSDGRWTTADIAARARNRGIDFLFLTDHNTASGVDRLRAQLGDAVAVHPGIELTTYHGHALALGADRWLDWRTGLRGRTADAMARDARAAGAFFVVAHPDAPPDDVCTGCRWTYADFDPSHADAVEVWGGLWDGPEERNQGCLDLWRKWLNARVRLTATGATDAHRPEDWEGPVPLTYVKAADSSLPAILAALRAGRTYVSSGPFLELRAREGDASVAELGDTVTVGPEVLFEARCAGGSGSELRLVADGSTVAREPVAGNGEGLLAATLPSSASWCCAELWSERGDVLRAVTSPIYLKP